MCAAGCVFCAPTLDPRVPRPPSPPSPGILLVAAPKGEVCIDLGAADMAETAAMYCDGPWWPSRCDGDDGDDGDDDDDLHCVHKTACPSVAAHEDVDEWVHQTTRPSIDEVIVISDDEDDVIVIEDDEVIVISDDDSDGDDDEKE